MFVTESNMVHSGTFQKLREMLMIECGNTVIGVGRFASRLDCRRRKFGFEGHSPFTLEKLA